MDLDVMKELNNNLSASLEHFQLEINKLRTGRAHPSMVEDVQVEAYGVMQPLKALATITTPEPQLIQISPFDPSTMQDISQSIRANQTLGLNPADDGRIIRIQVPALTEERRQLIVKQLGEKQEEAMIGLRKARHDAISVVDKAKKDKQISEDEASRLQKGIDEAVNDTKKQIEETSSEKEKDLLSI